MLGPEQRLFVLATIADPRVDFMPEAEVTHIRRTAHLLDAEYQEKYMEVVEKMRVLDRLNPLTFLAKRDRL